MNIIKYIYNYLLLTISSNLLLIILSSLLPLIVNLINGILYLDRILFFNISLPFCLLPSNEQITYVNNHVKVKFPNIKTKNSRRINH